MGGVKHLDAGDIAQLHRLVGDREGAGDHGLRCDDRGAGRQQDQGQLRPLGRGRQKVEGALEGVGVGEKERALSEVVQHQRRQHDPQPGAANGHDAEMAHVRIERLATRHRQHHRAKGRKAHERVAGEKAKAIERVYRHNHLRIFDNGENPQGAQGQEPHDHDRPEQLADGPGSKALDREEARDDDHGDGNDVGFQRRRRDFQPLDRTQHGDGGGDDGVPIKHGDAEEAHGEHGPVSSIGLHQAKGDGGEGDGSPLAIIVGPKDHEDIFDGDDHDQRPDHQRQDRHDIGLAGPADGLDGLLEGIERGGSDVAVDDAQRRNGEIGGGTVVVSALVFHHRGPATLSSSQQDPRATRTRR